MRIIVTIAFVFYSSFGFAQTSDVWTLQQSVRYALDHNISVQQNELNERLAKLTLQQSQLSQIPSLNASSSYGRSYGRSVDPTTNQFVNRNYDFFSAGGNADVLLFGWFQKRNTIARNKFLLDATRADLDQLRDDVSLNVATGYLRALLAKEQIRVNEKQVELSKAQLQQTRQFVIAGRLPELNAAQLESQLASDSANLINAIAAYNSAILDLKAMLNLDFATPLAIQAPKAEVNDQLDLGNMKPEVIYAEAVKKFGSIRGGSLRLKASQKAVAAARGALWPQLGANAQFGTNYATTFTEITSVTEGPPQQTLAYVPFSDPFSDTVLLPVYQPTFQYKTRRIPFNTQLDNNFRQTISFALNIPIFNSWQAQTTLKQAKLSMLSDELNKYNAQLKLKQDVYKAYNEALNAIQKFYAAERAEQAARRAYEFAQKRYDLGLTNTVEYLVTQNTQFVSESNLLSAKYDLIFKLKVIDYYLGKELKL